MALPLSVSEYRILLIDNCDLERHYFRLELENVNAVNFIITEASSGAEALLAIETQLPDCILLACSLPDISSIEMLRLIKKTTHKPVVILTSPEDVVLAEEALKNGAEMYYIKNPANQNQALVPSILSFLEDTSRTQKRKTSLAIVEAMDKINEKVRIRDEFLSITAHELRTPIAIAKMKLQIALRLIKNEQYQLVNKDFLTNLFSDSEQQINRLARLVDNLLDLSKLDSQIELHLEKVNLKNLVTDIYHRFKPQLVFSKCDVTIEIPEEITGNWDKDRLDQVFSNLFTNVTKYASFSKVLLKAKIKDSEVHIHFSDTGPGIPKKDFEKVFELHAISSSISSVRGFGIGLYISKKIVTAHGGEISLESDLGLGTIFHIRLPIK